ncbi:MAG: hypothetical protein V3W28_04435, partial [Thermoplasmata archaeon]
FFLMQALFMPGGRRKPSRGLVAILVVAPTMSAIFGLGFGQSLAAMLVPLLLSFVVIGALAWVWFRWSPRWGFQGVEQLQFSRIGRRVAIGAFLVVYILYGILLRPEFFPFDVAWVPVLLLYAGLVLLTAYYLRRAPPLPTSDRVALNARPTGRYLLLYLLTFLGIFLGLGALHSLLPGVLPVVATGIVFASVAIPVILLVSLAARALWNRRAPAPPLAGPVS